MTTKIIHLDTCFSDYFRGFSGVVIHASVTNETTVEQVVEQLVDDLDGQEDIPNVEEAILYAFKDMHLKRKWAPNLPDYEEDDDTPYAYFGLIPE